MLKSESIPGFYNGISQQSPALRLPTQGELQVNCVGTLTDGLHKRPPSEHVAQIVTSAASDSYYHKIERDNNERYIVIVTKNTDEPIEVWTPEGVKKTVKYGWVRTDRNGDLVYTRDDPVKQYLVYNGQWYGGLLNPQQDVRMCTIADYTIVVNTKYPTRMNEGERLENKLNEVIVWLKQSRTECKIKCAFNGSMLPDIGVGRGTDEIIADVASQLRARGANVANFGSVMLVRTKNNSDFTFYWSDGWGERASVVLRGTAQKFTDLPPTCWNGVRLKVEQDDNSKFDHYYVQFKTEDRSGYGPGVWVETRGWHQRNQFNVWTLPHQLVRMPDGSFVFGPCEWGERKVGDDETAPIPSFIGTTIQNVFMYRNRLGFISGDNIILSRASEFFEFFPRTVVDILDDDPIDIAATAGEVAKLRYAIGFEKQLMLLADDVQFALSTSNTIMTPTTVAVDVSTQFPCNPDVPPVASGSNLYFVSPGEQNTRVREYLVQPDTLLTDAADVTAHVPHYLPAGGGEMKAAPTYDMLFLKFNTQPHKVYNYTYYWNGDQKVQSAWCEWEFDSDILSVQVFDSWLYLIVGESGQIHLERISLEKLTSGELPFQVMLDRMVRLRGTYYSSLDYTYWTLPYHDTNNDYKLVHSVTGEQLPAFKYDMNHMAAPGNFANADVYAGRRYEARYRLSEWYPRQDEKNAVLDAVVKLYFVTLHFRNTGYFRVEVKAPGREPIQQALGPFTELVNGEKRFAVMSDAHGGVQVDIVNDSHLPHYIHTGERAGVITKKARPR